MTEEELLSLRETHRSGWEQEEIPSIFITHNIKTGNFAIRDWSGYLCKTNNPTLLLELIQMESLSSGSIRQLLSGISLQKLSLEYLQKRERLLRQDLPKAAPSKSESATLLDSLDLSDLL